MEPNGNKTSAASDLCSWSSNEIEDEDFGYVWSLKKFSKFPKADDLRSSSFRAGPKGNHEWQLQLYTQDAYVTIYLHLIAVGEDHFPKNSKVVKARVKLSIVDDKGEEKCFFENNPTDKVPITAGSYFCWSKFKTVADIFHPTTGLVSENGNLNIHCQMTVERMNIKNGPGGFHRQTVEEVRQDQLGTLSQRMIAFMTSSTFCDVTIATKAKRFQAHKIVLAARSPVFAAMLTSGMLESDENIVKIENFDADTVLQMLHFMYTGEVPELKEDAQELLRIANMYQLDGLQEICEVELATGLTVKNAADILLFAHLHNADKLKTAVFSFITRFPQVKETESFKKMGKSKGGTVALLEFYQSQDKK